MKGVNGYLPPKESLMELNGLVCEEHLAGTVLL